MTFRRASILLAAALWLAAAGCETTDAGPDDLAAELAGDLATDLALPDPVGDTAAGDEAGTEVLVDVAAGEDVSITEQVGDLEPDGATDTPAETDTLQQKMDELFPGIRPECRPKDLGCTADSECLGGKKCIGTRCVAPVPPADYQFSPDAFAVTGLALPAAGAGAGFDLNGDGKPDNLLADVIATYPGGSDLVNWTMKQFIDAGGLGMVFEFRDMPADGCGPIEVAIHHATADLNGDGVPDGNTYEVRHDSFRPDGFGPSSQFNTGAVDGGKMATGDGVGIPLQIVLPDGTALELLLEGARIQATMDTTPAGLLHFRKLNLADPAAPAGANAVIGGFIRVSRYSDSLNKSAKGCSCAGVVPATPVSSVTVDNDALSAACASGIDATKCSMDTDGRVCANLGGSCTALAVMGMAADVATGDTKDSKGNALKDAVSLALYVTLDAAKFADPPLAPEFKAVGDIWKTQNDCDLIRNNVKRRIGVLANDFYDTTVTPAIQSVTQGAHGTVEIGSTGDYVYFTPVADYAGFDEFTYTLQDGKGGQSTATVKVRMSPMQFCQGNWTLGDYCAAWCEQDRICDPDGYLAASCVNDCTTQEAATWAPTTSCSTARHDRACCRLSIPCAQWIEFKQGEAAIQAGDPPANMVCKSQLVNTMTSCGACPTGTWGASCTPCEGNADGPCGGIGTCSDGLTGDGTCTCPPGYAWNAATQACALPVDQSPVAGTGTTFTGSDGAVIDLSWGAATDDKTPAAELQYRVYQSLDNNIATVADCTANGAVAMDWTAGATTATVSTGIQLSTPYWFTVVVRDAAGNLTGYPTATYTTPASGKVILGCEAGYVTVGVYGSAGWWFDGVGIRCATLTAGTLGTISNGPYVGGTGGSPFTFDCPGGSILYAVKGNNGTSCSPDTTLTQFYQCIDLTTKQVGTWSQQYGGGNLSSCGPAAGGDFNYSCPSGQNIIGIAADAVVNGGSTYVGFTNGVDCK